MVHIQNRLVHVIKSPDAHEADEGGDIERTPLGFLKVEKIDDLIVRDVIYGGVLRQLVQGDEHQVCCADSLADRAVFFPEGEADDTVVEGFAEADEIPAVDDCALPRSDTRVVLFEIVRHEKGARR